MFRTGLRSIGISSNIYLPDSGFSFLLENYVGSHHSIARLPENSKAIDKAFGLRQRHVS
jgi:hypothetical protein